MGGKNDVIVTHFPRNVQFTDTMLLTEYLLTKKRFVKEGQVHDVLYLASEREDVFGDKALTKL